MFNQNITSNKFDLNLSTTLSSYWCTAIFTKSRSLHYVLKKQRKPTLKSERNDTEENDAFRINHVRITDKKTTLQRKNKKARFTRKRRHAEEKLNDANQIRTEDLRRRKSRHLLVDIDVLFMQCPDTQHNDPQPIKVKMQHSA